VTATRTTAPLQENPLAEGLERQPLAPTTLVVFGFTGDLSKRKILPAIYNLAHEGGLPDRFNLIGNGRTDLGEDGHRELAREAITAHSRRSPDPGVLEGLLERIHYVRGPADSGATYDRLADTVDGLDDEAGVRFNRIFYLATAPEFFEPIVEAIGEKGLEHRPGAEVRIVIEKPFGRDLASARRLNGAVLEVFSERQVFRIDHYLGKETVQNLLVMRFANGIFEPLWNRFHIDHVQITAAEDIGIGRRAGYYDSAGALRDIMQNHLLQLLTLLCMEPPVAFSATEVRNEKVKVLRAITPPTLEQVPEMAVRGQYGPGVVDGEHVPGYRDEPDVPPDSMTETYAALRLHVSNWRWMGVPFYLRGGKRLPRRVTEIAVALKPVPHPSFRQGGATDAQANQLVLAVQPNEGVSLSLATKVPGQQMRIRPVNMEFLYGTSFLSQSPEAYERLILDTMRGDATLFTRADEVEAAWSICDPILERWSGSTDDVEVYPAGTPGPEGADQLFQGGAKWRRL
jgi:glucose-6-phosphate 1-dehydrogenase